MTGAIECEGFTFLCNFDSANLSSVELVSRKQDCSKTDQQQQQNAEEVPDFEFNLWTRPDCAGTEFENTNSTWFYFAITGGTPFSLLKFNIMNLNKQSKIYSQGMSPVYKIVPGRNHWDRIKEKTTYVTMENTFILTFKHRTLENIRATTFFAFTYPFSYIDLQNMLNKIDNQFNSVAGTEPTPDSIYYHRECICYSLEKRRVELITVSSYHNITSERESCLQNMFPDTHIPRPFHFHNKKVVFVSARVHPGETPSSFVLNGLLHLLLAPEDPVAVMLRRLYVFKLMPMLNPDGVSQGHYRTDTRGVNLNRVYLRPSPAFHPSIYAARAILRYHHFGCEVRDEISESTLRNSENVVGIETGVSALQIDEKCKLFKVKDRDSNESAQESKPDSDVNFICVKDEDLKYDTAASCKPVSLKKTSESFIVLRDEVTENSVRNVLNSSLSGLALYVDLHGHASKKGIFMYGNHFDNIEDSIECMLLPKVMSINSQNFHFSACNFTERNMYLRDKRDGMSREGSGRVAVFKLTGLIHCYTLECNYNTGRTVNMLPPCSRDNGKPMPSLVLIPPKYTPHVFEEVGRALGISLLDITGHNPYSRIPNSEFRTMSGIRDWLKGQCISEQNRTYSTRRITRLSKQRKVSCVHVEESEPQPSTSTGIKESPQDVEYSAAKSSCTRIKKQFTCHPKCSSGETFNSTLKKSNIKVKKIPVVPPVNRQNIVSKVNFTKCKSTLIEKPVVNSAFVEPNIIESAKFKIENNELKFLPLNKVRVSIFTNRSKIRKDEIMAKHSPKRLKVSSLKSEHLSKSDDLVNTPHCSKSALLQKNVAHCSKLSAFPILKTSPPSVSKVHSDSLPSVSFSSSSSKMKKLAKHKIARLTPLKSLRKPSSFNKKKSGDSAKKLHKTVVKSLTPHGKRKTTNRNGNFSSLKEKKQKRSKCKHPN